MMLKLTLIKGHKVAMVDGRLEVASRSDVPVPKDWYRKNRSLLVREIATSIGVDIYQYQRYVVGKFGRSNYPGVMLDYKNVITGDCYQIFFNCEVTRARTTKAGKKGDSLPPRHFRVTENHAFSKFWLANGLQFPRLSEFHCCMGKLKNVFIVGTPSSNNKLDKATVKPATIAENQIRNALGLSSVLADKDPTKNRRQADSFPIKSSDKNVEHMQVRQGFGQIPGADDSATCLSNQVGAYNALPIDNLSRRDSQSWDAAQRAEGTPRMEAINKWVKEMEMSGQARKAGATSKAGQDGQADVLRFPKVFSANQRGR